MAGHCIWIIVIYWIILYCVQTQNCDGPRILSPVMFCVACFRTYDINFHIIKWFFVDSLIPLDKGGGWVVFWFSILPYCSCQRVARFVMQSTSRLRKWSERGVVKFVGIVIVVSWKLSVLPRSSSRCKTYIFKHCTCLNVKSPIEWFRHNDETIVGYIIMVINERHINFFIKSCTSAWCVAILSMSITCPCLVQTCTGHVST